MFINYTSLPRNDTFRKVNSNTAIAILAIA